MICLGIDTSAKTCSAALYSDTLLAEKTIKDGPTHSYTLLPAVKEILEIAKLSLSQIGLIAVAAGPGSFTGLRIGISTAKGLSFADQIPCAAVSTLEGLAMNAFESEGALVCPVMDARRGEFYNALFRIENSVPVRITPDRAIAGIDLAKELEGEANLVVLGDGAEKFLEQNPIFSPHLSPESIRYQSALSVAKVGLGMAAMGQTIACEQLSPTYLRLPQAQREWLEKNQNQK